MELRDKLKQLSKADCLQFAVWCARKVSHLNDDPRVEAAIVATENWIKAPSEDNRKKAANAAADAAAAYAAAAAAADAAAAAADAAAAANAAAAWAAANAVRALNEAVTKESLFSEWLDSHLLGEAK